MEQMEQVERNKQRNGYWSGLLSGLLLAILLFGCIFIGKQVYQIFEAKRIAEETQAQDAELLNDYTAAKIDILEDTIHQYYLEEADRGNPLFYSLHPHWRLLRYGG